MIGKANGSGKVRNRKSRPLEQQRNHGEYRDVNDKPPSRPNAIGATKDPIPHTSLRWGRPRR